MRLTHKQALEVFALKGDATFEDIKIAYRKSCSKYHPDRNPAGLEMMKVVNAAWTSLSDYVEGSVKFESEEDLNLGDEMNEALNKIINLGLNIEICGSWIWVNGDTKPHKETLKDSGYNWAPKKCLWMWKPEGVKSKGRGKFSMDEIRDRHGSTFVKAKTWKQVGVAA